MHTTKKKKIQANITTFKKAVGVQIMNNVLCALSLVTMFTFLACNRSSLTRTAQTKNDEIRVAMSDNPTTLDFQDTNATLTAQITRNIYDTLLQDEKGNPQLAESWTSSPDRLEWTFTLRKDVVFHHGKHFTAEDVIATFQRFKENSSSPFVSEINNIAHVVAKDDYTVQFTLSQTLPGMPFIFASSHMAILPADLIAQNHNFSRNPVGTGPFMFEEWKDNIYISLVKNAQYFADPPNIQALSFLIISDTNAQVQALIRKDVDIVPYIIEPALTRLKNREEITITTFPGSTILLLAMNTRIEPFNTLAFRKAVAESIDKQKIIDIAYPSSKRVNMFWHTDSPYYQDVAEIYDETKAKNFFNAQAPIPPITITVPTTFAPHVKASLLYKTMLEQVGLTVEIKQVNWARWLNEVYGQGRFQMTVIGHTGKISPDQRLDGFINGGGYIGWDNPQFSALVTEAKRAQDRDTQIDLYRQALTLMTEAYPFVFIAENATNIAIRNTIKKVRFHPIFETYDFSHAIISD